MSKFWTFRCDWCEMTYVLPDEGSAGSEKRPSGWLPSDWQWTDRGDLCARCNEAREDALGAVESACKSNAPKAKPAFAETCEALFGSLRCDRPKAHYGAHYCGAQRLDGAR